MNEVYDINGDIWSVILKKLNISDYINIYEIFDSSKILLDSNLFWKNLFFQKDYQIITPRNNFYEYMYEFMLAKRLTNEVNSKIHIKMNSEYDNNNKISDIYSLENIMTYGLLNIPGLFSLLILTQNNAVLKFTFSKYCIDEDFDKHIYSRYYKIYTNNIKISVITDYRYVNEKEINIKYINLDEYLKIMYKFYYYNITELF